MTAQSGSLTLANLASDFDAAQVGNNVPTHIVTTPAVFSIIEALFTPTVSHTYSQVDIRFTENGPLTIGANRPAGSQGFRTLYWRGIPVIADEKCTSGNIYTLNLDHFYWYQMPQPSEFNRTENRGFGWTGWKEAVNQDGVAGQFLLYGQLITDSPRLSARRTGVTS